MAIVRIHGTHNEISITIPDEYAREITTYDRVLLTSKQYIISDILQPSIDEKAMSMEVIDKPNVSYEMIGGLDNKLDEIINTVKISLSCPEELKEMGITPPNGILLHGKPGTGKTLIAKAIATNTNATFIKLTGSEVVQKYIGEGARIIRDLFRYAKENAPSVIFIDEIDAIGSCRNYNENGTMEVHRTMMQLLTEIDGFDSMHNVQVIAATNRIDSLDPALMRYGRFDRIINIPLPNKESRFDILKVHTKNICLSSDVTDTELMNIAENTDGFCGARLGYIIKEAGILAFGRGSKCIEMSDINQSWQKSITEENERVMVSSVQPDIPSSMYM
jgi:proteasome regulatory subunit